MNPPEDLATNQEYGDEPPKASRHNKLNIKKKAEDETMTDVPRMHEDPSGTMSGNTITGKRRREEEQPMPGIEHSSASKRETDRINSRRKQKEFESQRLTEPAANQILWIQDLLTITESRRSRASQSCFFQYKPWGPNGRTWAASLIGGDLIMTKIIFELQNAEMCFFLELRSALASLEELLDIAGIWGNRVQNQVHGNFETPKPTMLGLSLNQAFYRIIHATRNMNEKRRAMVACLVAKDVAPENIAGVAKNVPTVNGFFPLLLTQYMPKGADSSKWDQLDKDGFRTIMEHASELRKNMEGWRADSDLELLHMKDLLATTWPKLPLQVFGVDPALYPEQQYLR
ncbi:MAG: hypothetical protein Q9169_004328 [Polycauliona sp. 2 TL-2023]